jgi:hypothetical protein
MQTFAETGRHQTDYISAGSKAQSTPDGEPAKTAQSFKLNSCGELLELQGNVTLERHQLVDRGTRNEAEKTIVLSLGVNVHCSRLQEEACWG